RGRGRAQEAARQRPDARREPAVLRRIRHAAQYQRGYRRRRHRGGPPGGEADPRDRRSRHTGEPQGSAVPDLLHRPGRAAPAARPRLSRRRHAAQGRGDRVGTRGRRRPRARRVLEAARRPAARGVHERRHRHAGGRRHRRPHARRAGFRRGAHVRLWEKGLPLAERVLRYTAGEDYRLDERLVAYDVRASIAHAEMLAEAGLLDAEDCRRIREGLTELAARHAAGEWHIALEDEDVHTALETRLTALVGEAGARVHLGRSRNDQVLAALRLYLLDAAGDLAARLAS